MIDSGNIFKHRIPIVCMLLVFMLLIVLYRVEKTQFSDSSLVATVRRFSKPTLQEEVDGRTEYKQGCISCGILVSGIGARGVSSEHMENMEMFSCSPT